MLFTIDKNFFTLAGIGCLFIVTLSVQAVPIIEKCPQDTVLANGSCVCQTSTCQVPTCEWQLEIVVNGTEIPGSCCPIYECTGCANESLIEGKCPCAPGAVINEKGICDCVDKEYHLVNGVCVCNPLQCELPQICDRKHVLTRIDDGCCKKTMCIPCPEDSESTNLDSDDIEDHCVCLPCKNDCGANKTIAIKKKGTGFPGACCDIYSCEPLEEKNSDCVVGDIIHSDGDTWSTADTAQECRCQNGLSLCTPADDPRNCIDDNIIYKHTAKWKKDDDCTECNCFNGRTQCFSHYCEFKETKIKENESHSCSFDDQIYEHLQTWNDNCTLCQCINGVNHCNSTCEIKEIPDRNECHPLADCNKQCPNGFRINKKGCEICKCNPQKVSQTLLNKYNISMNELIDILEDYAKNKTITEPSTKANTTTTTTTSTSSTTTTTEMPIVTLIRRHGLELEQSTTEVSVTQNCVFEDGDSWKKYMNIVSYVVCAILVIYIILIKYNSCASKKTHNITSNRGSYQVTYQVIDNNSNTIKETPLR